MGIATLDGAQLLRTALCDGEHFTACDPGPKKTPDALLATPRFPDFEQLPQVAEVQDAKALRRLATQFLTALLPQAKANRTDHQARATRGPKGGMAESELMPPPRQFPHERSLPTAGGT